MAEGLRKLERQKMRAELLGNFFRLLEKVADAVDPVVARSPDRTTAPTADLPAGHFDRRPG